MQTGLVLEQISALATSPVDSDGDGIPDDVEIVLGSNPTVADARYLADKGNGNAQSGATVPVILSVGATVNQAFNYSLTSTLGVPPFTWSLVGGLLPPGLALSSSGLISGIPSQLGSYTFQYASTDSGSPQITRRSLGLITVIRRPCRNRRPQWRWQSRFGGRDPRAADRSWKTCAYRCTNGCWRCGSGRRPGWRYRCLGRRLDCQKSTEATLILQDHRFQPLLTRIKGGL